MDIPWGLPRWKITPVRTPFTAEENVFLVKGAYCPETGLEQNKINQFLEIFFKNSLRIDELEYHAFCQTNQLRVCNQNWKALAWSGTWSASAHLGCIHIPHVVAPSRTNPMRIGMLRTSRLSSEGILCRFYKQWMRAPFSPPGWPFATTLDDCTPGPCSSRWKRTINARTLVTLIHFEWVGYGVPSFKVMANSVGWQSRNRLQSQGKLNWGTWNLLQMTRKKSLWVSLCFLLGTN